MAGEFVDGGSETVFGSDMFSTHVDVLVVVVVEVVVVILVLVLADFNKIDKF